MERYRYIEREGERERGEREGERDTEIERENRTLYLDYVVSVHIKYLQMPNTYMHIHKHI